MNDPSDGAAAQTASGVWRGAAEAKTDTEDEEHLYDSLDAKLSFSYI